MARKDRERARKRHAIQRARREAGYEPAPKAERPATKTQTRTRRPATGGRAQPQPLLPRGPDHQVGVGLAGGVQMVGYVLHVEDLGEFLDAGALGRVIVQQ